MPQKNIVDKLCNHPGDSLAYASALLSPGRLLLAPTLLAVALTMGCGTRGLGYDLDRDSGVTDGSQGDGRAPDGAQGDGSISQDQCAPMEARQDPAVRCDGGDPIGWTWTGWGCLGIPCACEGADCAALYGTEGACLSARAPACLPPPDCLGLGWEACEERTDCQAVLYGGGCIDLDSCEMGGPTDGNWLCWERGFVCLPAGAPCSDLPYGQCDGDCYWWERRSTHCFGDMGDGDCCVEEGYGFCAPISRPQPGCEAQSVLGCSDPCVNLVGYYWDGAFCAPIRCCCEGPDCGGTYSTLEACLDARAECTENACAVAGGTCNYGDAVIPTCDEGYGTDYSITETSPGACGLGVCCTPCPDPTQEGVWYAAHSPIECADIDFDCFDLGRHFDNECGCGCIEN
ncbi:MAG: hypothetical protein RBU30_02865 [Polyangia bacterium]|nr:hypothetical protein [Polyangia bacterium]